MSVIRAYVLDGEPLAAERLLPVPLPMLFDPEAARLEVPV
jgi:hypothetical protein